MTLHRSMWVDRDASLNGVQPIDTRLGFLGLLVEDGAAGLSCQQGVFYDGGGSVITGTTATGTMTYQMRACAFAMYLLGTAASGVVIGANDGNITVNTTTAPGSNSRIDVIWVRQTAVASDGGGDATNTLIIGCTQGTAAASPLVPAIPTGAYALAQAVVLSTTTQTSTTVITQVHGWTNAAGGPIMCRTQAERDALTPFDGMSVYRLDLHADEKYVNGAWARQQQPFPQANLANRPRRILTRTSTFTLVNNVQTAVGAWSADAGDDGGSTGLAQSGSIMTATYGGLYEVDYSMAFPAGAGGSGIFRILMLKNGAVGPPATGTIVGMEDAPTTGQAILSFRCKVFLNPGDTLQTAAFQNSGASQTLGSTVASIVRWAVEWVGP